MDHDPVDTDQRFRKHNVIASFDEMDAAKQAIDSLNEAGIKPDAISFLARGTEERLSPEERRTEEEAAHGATAAIPPEEMRSEDADSAADVAKSIAAGSVLGSTAGAVAGFIAGAIAFGIPGVGPAVGSAVWAATVGGAVAGATGGGVVGGFWKMRYRDEFTEGRVLVGVHADDEDTVTKGEATLKGHSPRAIDRFDESGQLLGTRD